MKEFGGKILFLDRSDINTDEIIPARYLTVLSKNALAPHLLEDLRLEGFDPDRDISGKGVLVTRANFGCGSSREHAAWALETNGIQIVIAESFARIFRQNMYNCGMLAIELPGEEIERVFRDFAGHGCDCAISLDPAEIVLTSGENSRIFPFSLTGFDRDLILAGGWLEYADKRYG
jgi:3-isopropylmalate/(R)-2-methylmalate dehydratase small subunit